MLFRSAFLTATLWLGISGPAWAGPYPCGLTPPPQFCWGQKKMLAGYSGNAVTVYNPTTAQSAGIGFSGDALDTTALDTLLAGNTGIVTRWFEQKNAVHLDQIDSGQSPVIGTLTVGNSRSLICQGGTQIGALSGLQTGNFSGLGLNITAKDYTIVAVVKPSSSLYVNQAGAPDVNLGALVDLVAATPVTVNGAITSSSASVTGMSSTTGINANDVVQAGGVGIAAGTTIANVNNATTITLSAPALTDGTFNLLYTRPGLLAPNFLSTTLTASSTSATMASTAELLAGDGVWAGGIAVDTTVQSTTATTVTLNVAANLTGTTPLIFSRPTARLYNNANSAVRGGWSVNDGGAFSFVANGSYVQTNPTVVVVASDATGVRLYQDGQVVATASRSALTRTAALLTLCKLASSAPGAWGHAFDGGVVALMVYDSGLSQSEVAFVVAALQTHYGIDPSVATFNTNLVALTGDSIPAGYKTVGAYGYLDYLQGLVTHTTRFLNFADPGSTVTQNPAGGPAYANQTGLFPLAITPQLTATSATKGRVVVIHGGGNDTGFGPAARSGTTHGTTTIDGISDTSDLTVGDYVFCPTLSSTLTTIASKAANSITISAAATATGACTLQFTYAATSPAAVHTAIVALVTAATNAGATKVIVSTVLKRVSDVQPWLTALNVLINAGVTGATVVDCASFSNASGNLATNPGPAYADSAHLTALGHQLMAACLQSAVDSGLT